MKTSIQIALTISTLCLALAFNPSIASEEHKDEHHHDEKHSDTGHQEVESGHEPSEEHDDHQGQDEHSEHGEHDDHEEEPSAGVGPGKAVLAASKSDGIRLSEKALQTLQIKTLPIQSVSDLQVPIAALVFHQAETGIYRFRDGWFKLIPVQMRSRKAESARISSPEIQTGDQVAVSGVPLLRVADLEAWGGSGDGHGH